MERKLGDVLGLGQARERQIVELVDLKDAIFPRGEYSGLLTVEKHLCDPAIVDIVRPDAYPRGEVELVPQLEAPVSEPDDHQIASLGHRERARRYARCGYRLDGP